MDKPLVVSKIKPLLSKLFKGWGVLDLAVFGAMIVLFMPTFYRLVDYGWKRADYTHAYFILPISLWLIFQKREELVPRAGTSVPAVFLFAVGMICCVFAAMNAFMFLESIAFVLVFSAVMMVRLDTASVKKILFPLGYLWFLVPPPSLVIDMITFPLKAISTAGSYQLLKIAHIPVEVEGAILKVGNYELFVADACSGFRSMTTLLALGAIFAYFQKTTTARRWIIFASVVPLGIAANIFRIFLTGCIAYLIGMKYAEGFFHEFSGAVLFVVAVSGLMLVANWLTKDTHEKK